MEADILHARKTPLLFLGGVARIALCAAGPGRSTALRHSNQSNQATKEKLPLFLGGVARIALCAAGPGRSTALRHSD